MIINVQWFLEKNSLSKEKLILVYDEWTNIVENNRCEVTKQGTSPVALHFYYFQWSGKGFISPLNVVRFP